MKSITVVASYPLSEPVVKNRLEPFMRSLLSAGYSISLVSPAGGVLSEDLAGRVKHLTVTCPARLGDGFFLRAIHEAWLANKLLNAAAKLDSVNVFITIPSMFLLFFFRSNAGRRYLDVRDLTWEYLSERNFITRNAKKLFRVLAGFRVREFDLVSATNDTELKYLSSLLSVDADRLVYMPNGISLRQYEMLDPLPLPLPLPLPRNVADRLKVMYIGNVGLAQHLTTLVAAAERMQSYDFVIVGDGNDYARVKNICSERRLNNISFTGRIAWEEIPSMYCKADMLYAQLLPDYAGAMPSKIYEYLATGKFLVYGGQGQAADALRDFEHNLVVPPGDVDALCNALKWVGEERKWGTISLGNRKKIYDMFIRERNSVELVRRIAEI